jgi:hypothetical protein
MAVDSSSANSPLPSEYSRPLLDQLVGEYKIAQDKIDKIAGFRFTIRGWSVTLVVAFAFGANTLKLPPYWILSALLPLTAFLLMERSQRRNHHVLSSRAIRLEKRIWRTLRLSMPVGSAIMIGGMVPRLGHDLAEESQSDSSAIRWLKANGDAIFYGSQLLLVVSAAIWVSRLQQETPRDDGHEHQVIFNNWSSEGAVSEGTPNGKTQIRHCRP